MEFSSLAYAGESSGLLKYCSSLNPKPWVHADLAGADVTSLQGFLSLSYAKVRT